MLDWNKVKYFSFITSTRQHKKRRVVPMNKLKKCIKEKELKNETICLKMLKKTPLIAIIIAGILSIIIALIFEIYERPFTTGQVVILYLLSLLPSLGIALFFDPNATTRPAVLRDQIGWYRSDASVDTSSSAAANNVNLLVETAILNYLALQGREGEYASLFGGLGSSAASLSPYIAFPQITS